MFQIDDPNAINQGGTIPAFVHSTGTAGWWGEGNASTGTPSTQVQGDWLNVVQAEMMALASFAGQTLGRTAAFNQMMTAVARVAGAHVLSISASVTLTADNTGLVLINAASANIAITLPAAASAGGTPLRYLFRRTDATAHTVSVTCEGSDTFSYSNAAAVTIGADSGMEIVGDGIGQWWMVSAVQRATGSTGYVRRADGMLEQWGLMAFSGVPSIPSTYPGDSGFTANAIGAVYFPVTFPAECYTFKAIGVDDGTYQEGSEWSVACDGVPSQTNAPLRVSRVNGANATGSETGLIMWHALGE